PLHPGSLSRQYHVCGRTGCGCVDPQKPRPHGPYAKLTYVYHGKFTCRFVRARSVNEVTRLLASFKTFRRLTDEWIGLGIQCAELGPLERLTKKSKICPPGTKPRQRRDAPRSRWGPCREMTETVQQGR